MALLSHPSVRDACVVHDEGTRGGRLVAFVVAAPTRRPTKAALRRYLVESRYLARASGVYRLRPETDWPADPDADALPPASGNPQE